MRWEAWIYQYLPEVEENNQKISFRSFGCLNNKAKVSVFGQSEMWISFFHQNKTMSCYTLFVLITAKTCLKISESLRKKCCKIMKKTWWETLFCVLVSSSCWFNCVLSKICKLNARINASQLYTYSRRQPMPRSLLTHWKLDIQTLCFIPWQKKTSTFKNMVKS